MLREAAEAVAVAAAAGEGEELLICPMLIKKQIPAVPPT